MHGLETHIAKRLMSGGDKSHRLAGPAIKVATAAVALGMVVMLLAVGIGHGFKREIRNKIVGFGTHIQVTSLNLNSSFETAPIHKSAELVESIMEVRGVRSVQPFITKPGIIKTDDAFQGIALKGVDSSYDWTFLKSVMVSGHEVSTPDSAKSLDIMLSQSMADNLKLTLGDPVRMFFVKDGDIRARKFTLCGIFNSHFEEYDNTLAYVDMRQLAQLNNWTEDQISGYEVMLQDFDQMEEAAEDIAALCMNWTIGSGRNGDSRKSNYVTDPEANDATLYSANHETPYGVLSEAGQPSSEMGDEFLRVRHIKDMQPQIFGWLALLDQNILVILVLIIAVAGLNMVSGLLILILEHTNAIGILKALGMTNGMLRGIFIRMALRIVGRGLIVGNAVGIALCLIQHFTGLVQLDPENYYLDTVPVLLTVPHVLMLNVGTALIAFLLLLGPSGLVARISPAKSIKFN